MYGQRRRIKIKEEKCLLFLVFFGLVILSPHSNGRGRTSILADECLKGTILTSDLFDLFIFSMVDVAWSSWCQTKHHTPGQGAVNLGFWHLFWQLFVGWGKKLFFCFITIWGQSCVKTVSNYQKYYLNSFPDRQKRYFEIVFLQIKPNFAQKRIHRTKFE